MKLCRQGYKRRVIAERLGVTYGTLCRALREMGMSTPHPKPPAGKTYKKDFAMLHRRIDRCPECGAKAQLETTGICLECTLLNTKRAKRL